LYFNASKLPVQSFSLLSLRSLILPPSRMGCLLGYGGIIPFLGLGLAAHLLEGTRQTQVLFALMAYGGTILSFLGAIHWGLALRDSVAPSAILLAWGVVPSLMSWVALLIGASAGLWLLAVGLWICFVVDRQVYPRFGLIAWLGMRLALTTIASLACIAAALGAA
jgi:hypothetical protein